MEELAFRYQAEFNISVQVNGSPAGDAIEILPSPGSQQLLNNYGLLVKPIPGGAMVFVRQKLSGVNWVPSVTLTQPVKFSFWFIVRQGADVAFLDFFKQGTQRFGRQILYTNNLSAAGVIDANLAGNVVSLTAGAAADNAERGALSNYIVSLQIAPGDYNMIRAGEIKAGAPVSFPISDPITAAQSSVSLDFRQLNKGAYVLRLEGAVPVQERVVFDQVAAGSEVNGVIDIHRDNWFMPAQPREYRINFLST